MTDVDRYASPLAVRYASGRMQSLWGPRHRAGLWRRLWLALATHERALGVDIPDAALEQMRANLDTVDLDAVREYERQFRHDVMAHVHHFGDQAPAARGVIHLGATSAFVTDNADLIVLRDALRLLLGRVRRVLEALRELALEHRDRPTVAYTHFQPAQLTTVGKRATLWLQDFAIDAERLRRGVEEMWFRGCKGTTGTQASFLDLFDGDHDRVRELDRQVATEFGFSRSAPVSGQTYTRKLDSHVLDLTAGLAQSAAKFATDLRLLQHEGEMLEPVEPDQIGSSAMPYKRNPMRAERICALSRYAISLRDNAAQTASTQWFERTLDDSANRRLALPQSFLSLDAVLMLVGNVAAGVEIRANTIRTHVERVMPFMATERWLMLAVRAGGDRQSLHEVIRQHAWTVSDAMEQGAANDLLDRLANDPLFANLDRDTLQAELDPGRYVGRASAQVGEFLDDYLAPLLATLQPYAIDDSEEISV